MNTRNEWQKILRLANEELKPKGYEIRISDKSDPGFFSCKIYKGRKLLETYAENYYESELEDLVTDAWVYAKNKANL